MPLARSKLATREFDISEFESGLCACIPDDIGHRGDPPTSEDAKARESNVPDLISATQLPVWGLCMKELSLLTREWRNSPATGSTGFAYKHFGHVACLACQPSRPH